MRLADLMPEAFYMKQKTSRTCHGRIKNKDGNNTSKSQSQNHGRRAPEIWRDGKKSGRFRYIINFLRNCNFLRKIQIICVRILAGF